MKTPINNCKWAKYPLGDVTQWIGENIPLYKGLGIGLNNGHNGIDLVRPWGEHMFAVEKGIVSDLKTDEGGYGMHVRIKSADGKREWTYGHCSQILVTKGQEVQEGQFIACMGNTGFVVSGNTPYWKVNPYAGTHLHFGLRIFNKGKVQNYDNGSLGAVDPLPYFLDATKKSYKILRIASDKQDKALYTIATWMQSVGL